MITRRTVKIASAANRGEPTVIAPRVGLPFGQVRQGLQSLGFKYAVGDGLAVFKEPKTDTIVAFRHCEPSCIVRPAYLLGAKQSVVFRGVASEDAYNRAMDEARLTAPPETFVPKPKTAAPAAGSFPRARAKSASSRVVKFVAAKPSGTTK